jgi:hypothetical protein
MTKPPLYRGRERFTCCYCKRPLQVRDKDATDGLTWDHVRAESDGGWKKVPCCRMCNFLKDNNTPEDWFWFIGAHPRWWREFTHPSQVKRVVREFRFNQAQSRKRRGFVSGRRRVHVPNYGSYRGQT